MLRYSSGSDTMDKKFRVGILGATGAVGQNYINLLRDHPWFTVTYVTASEKNVGKKYIDAVSERGWFMQNDIPKSVASLLVSDTTAITHAQLGCDFVFSALDKEAKEIEPMYAKAGIPVVSNSSANRWDPFVPMIIPEINPNHLDVIALQKKERGYGRGFIVVKPNCSIQSYMMPIHALIKAGYVVDKMIITTQQAASGAGRPGVSSMDLIDNIIPYIGSGEEEKSENEPLKIFGRVTTGGIESHSGLKISATCTRVPVRDGHSASVHFSIKADKKPEIEDIIRLWRQYTGEPQKANLPFAPNPPIVYRDEINRPQPMLDRNTGNGMAITVGRLRPCSIFDYKFFCLSHNTVRGAAGGGILNAELLNYRGYFDK